MSLAKQLYPEEDQYYFCICDYQPILNSFGEILIQVDDNDYQGDSRVLIKNENKYGLLIFGWGSCSGCDALQGCSDYQDVDDLIKGLENDIQWFDSLNELKKYVKEKDWKLTYAWHAEETKEFIEKVLNYNNE